MGASSSKPARSAAQAVSRRQYPKQPSTPSPATSRPPPPPPPPKSQSPTPRAAPQPRQPESASQGPTYHSKEKASIERSSAIDLDGRDPHFAASLRSIGPVTPSPTLSNSSTFNQPKHTSKSPGVGQTVFPSPSMNPALLVITARQRIAKEAEQEVNDFGREGFSGRGFLDAFTVRQVLDMRDRQRLGEGEIERALRLKGGVVRRLGEKGIVGIP
ncbi:hypothetical protein BJX99DRAFT_233483 [Aspergillus californicus]